MFRNSHACDKVAGRGMLLNAVQYRHQYVGVLFLRTMSTVADGVMLCPSVHNV